MIGFFVCYFMWMILYFTYKKNLILYSLLISFRRNKFSSIPAFLLNTSNEWVQMNTSTVNHKKGYQLIWNNYVKCVCFMLVNWFALFIRNNDCVSNNWVLNTNESSEKTSCNLLLLTWLSVETGADGGKILPEGLIYVINLISVINLKVSTLNSIPCDSQTCGHK